MNLVLSIDYELYGDGSGDIFEHMIKPTKKILDCCDSHNIKTTIFFEIIEYIRIKEEWERGNKMGYSKNPIEAINKQILSAVEKGHDVQLHLHPQWIKAKYFNDSWHVDKKNWRLGDFSITNNYSTYELLLESKRTLEGLIKQVMPNYKCIALRAGGYNILPSKKIYDAMVKLGIKIDSSVYPGGYENGELNRYDYRGAKDDLDYWNVNPNDFSIKNIKSEVIEIPIFALQLKRFKKLSTKRISSALANKKSAMSSVTGKISKKNFFEKIMWIFEKEAFTWDFCLFGKKMHKSFFKYINSNFAGKRNYYVLIGHPKGLTDIKTLQSLITLSIKNKASFITLKQFHDSIS